MANPRNYLIGFFALTTIGLAVVVWKQERDLIKLSDGETVADHERADWQKKVWAAEKRVHELEQEVAGLRAQGTKKASDVADASDPASLPGGGRPRRGPGARFGNLQALMNDPQFAKLMALQQKAMVDSRYAPLFKQLALTPAQLQQFQNLLAEKQSAARDVLAAAAQQGLNFRTDRAEVSQLISQSNSEIDSQIQSTLGPDAFAQYQTYEQTLPQRNTVTQLQQSLSYTSTPLTDAQANQLVQILASTSPQNGNANGGGLGGLLGGPGGFGGQGRVTDAAINQAQGVLSQPQVDALQQLQQQQQAQAEMARMMRNSFQPQGGGATATASGTTTAGSTKSQ